MQNLTPHRNVDRASSRGLVATTLLLACALPAPVVAMYSTGAFAQEEDHVIRVDVGRSQEVDAPWRVRGAAITDPSIADIQVLTPELLMVSGRSSGVTDVVIWGEAGESDSMRVEVSANLERLQAELDGLLPGASVSVNQSQSVVLISGALLQAEQSTHIRDYMTAMDVKYVDTTSVPGPQQVNVQIRIAEVSRTALRSLGVNGFAAGNDAFIGSTVGSSTGGAINPISIGPALSSSAAGDTNFVFNQPADVSPLVTLFAGSTSGDWEIFLQALEENQLLRLLAEPNLTALSGEEASFLVGGEFPIPVVQATSGGTGTSITIEYKEYGVGLNFRPIVLGNGEIRVDLTSEVSDLSDVGAVEIEGFRVPAIVTRRVNSTIEMHNGETFMMAGLINESATAVASNTPILGNLPIIGSLFRSVRYKAGETELVIMATVALVEPLAKKILPPLPGTTGLIPTDWELYVEGRIEGVAPARLSPADSQWFKNLGLGRLKGPGAWSIHESKPAPHPAINNGPSTAWPEEEVQSVPQNSSPEE